METAELREQKKLIGEGTFGEVWTMKLKNNSTLFVQKINRCVTDVVGCRSEVLCLSRLAHFQPKLVYSGYTTDGKWCLIMQYFSGGTLSYHIHEEIKKMRRGKQLKITPEQKKYIAYHLALAIEFLHSYRFIHG